MKYIFNSLGSNYNFTDCLHAMYASDDKKYRDQLVHLLEKKYGGEVQLVYKGREAIELALQLLQLPEGSKVAINGFTCYVVYKPVKDQKLDAVYVDVEKDGVDFSPKEFQKAINQHKNIKVVIIQNTLGYPVDIEEIEKICKKNNIILIEDLAHCVGSKYTDGREVGTVGDFTCLSFSQDKMIDGVSGGALVVRNSKFRLPGLELKLGEVSKEQQFKDRYYPFLTFLIRKAYPWEVGKVLHAVFKICHLLSHPMGQEDTFFIHTLPDWYAFLALLQFEKLQENISHRQKIAKVYSENLDEKVLVPGLKKMILNSSNVRFPILVEKRFDLILFLKQNKIFVSDIWYDAPIAPKKYMAKTDYNGECPNAEDMSQKILNLPTHKNVNEEDAKFICEKINAFLVRK